MAEVFFQGAITHITGGYLVEAQLDAGNHITAAITAFETAVTVGERTFFGSKVSHPTGCHFHDGHLLQHLRQLYPIRADILERCRPGGAGNQ